MGCAPQADAKLPHREVPGVVVVRQVTNSEAGIGRHNLYLGKQRQFYKKEAEDDRDSQAIWLY